MNMPTKQSISIAQALDAQRQSIREAVDRALPERTGCGEADVWDGDEFQVKWKECAKYQLCPTCLAINQFRTAALRAVDETEL